MPDTLTEEELLAKAKKRAEDAIRLHPLYRGKIQTAPKCPIRGLDDFAIWYTPGVAAPCRAIHEDEDLWPMNAPTRATTAAPLAVWLAGPKTMPGSGSPLTSRLMTWAGSRFPAAAIGCGSSCCAPFAATLASGVLASAARNPALHLMSLSP